MNTIKTGMSADKHEYLSKYSTSCLKGFFAILVLAHHLYQHSGIFRGTYLGTVFQALGYLSVAMFFFMSGYGLMVSYYNKTRDYVKKFFSKRILPFFIIYVILTLIYSLFRIYLGETIGILRFFKSFLIGNTLVANGWYLQIIFLFYLFFWIVCYFVKNPKMQLRCLLIIIILYCVVCRIFMKSPTIYESSLAFVLGIFWFAQKEKIDKRIENNKLACILVSFVAFALSFLISLLIQNKDAEILFKMISAVSFVLFFLCFYKSISKINSKILCNEITKRIGKISLEIYVTQGLFLKLFHSEIIYINNPYIYVVLVSASTIIFSLVLSPVFSYTYKVCAGFCKKNENINSAIAQ